MTHTFEVQVCLNYSTYQYLLENLPSLTKVGKKYRTNYYSKKGITQIELIKYVANDNSFTSFYLKLRCNLSLIMGESDILLLDENKYSVDQILKQFRKRLHEINQLRYINLHEYHINELSVVRVDFAVDLLLDNPNILVYLSNMSMQHNYRNLKRTKINKNANVLYYESCHYQSKSRTLNIYNKYKSVINSSREPPSVIEEVVKQTVRVEFQIKKKV